MRVHRDRTRTRPVQLVAASIVEASRHCVDLGVASRGHTIAGFRV